MKLAFWIALFGVLSLPAAASARDAGRVRLLRVPQEEIHAGELVDLTWSRPPRNVEELEILLSVDGGRHFALRVSPELDARDGHWRWRVPDRSAEHASLRLRLGDAREESWGEPTPEFRIVGTQRSAVGRASAAAAGERDGGERQAGERETAFIVNDPNPVHEAAWWSASESTAAGPGARGIRSEEPAFARATESVSFAPPRREVADREALDAPRAAPAEPLCSVALPQRVSLGVSRNLPLRE